MQTYVVVIRRPQREVLLMSTHIMSTHMILWRNKKKNYFPDKSFLGEWLQILKMVLDSCCAWVKH